MTMKLGVFADWLVPHAGAAYDRRAWEHDLQMLQHCGVGSVVLGLGKIHLVARKADVAEACSAAYDYGLAPWVMIWASRQRAWLRDTLPRFAELADESTAAGSILDAERAWHRGIYDASSAADDVVEMMPPDQPWAVTGLAICQRSLWPLAEAAPVTIPQAYSVWEPDRADGKKPIRTDPPPKLQIRSYQSWLPRVRDPRAIEMGLACYFQARPAMTREQCLTGQLLAAEQLGVGRAWFWSLKWLRAQGWAQAILRGYSGAQG